MSSFRATPYLVHVLASWFLCTSVNEGRLTFKVVVSPYQVERRKPTICRGRFLP